MVRPDAMYASGLIVVLLKNEVTVCCQMKRNFAPADSFLKRFFHVAFQPAKIWNPQVLSYPSPQKTSDMLSDLEK